MKKTLARLGAVAAIGLATAVIATPAPAFAEEDAGASAEADIYIGGLLDVVIDGSIGIYIGSGCDG
jgi:predicted MFS family arabinose efflux permease